MEAVSSVSVVIPAYNEPPDAIAETVEAVLNQTHPVDEVIVVDDASPIPVGLPRSFQDRRVRIVRLEENRGVSAARNRGIESTASALVLCLDVEVVLEPDWIERCVEYMAAQERCGACCGRVKPAQPRRVMSRWRFRFLEAKYEVEGTSGVITHATGHALLIKREALDEIGGYSEELFNFHEDSDVCFRLKDAGWETHVNTEAHATSIQVDNLRTVIKKHLRNDYWALDARGLSHPYTRPVEWPGFFFHVTKGLFIRLARNTYRRYWSLLPIDVAVWGYSLWLGAHINYDETAPVERSVTMPQVEGQP